MWVSFFIVKGFKGKTKSARLTNTRNSPMFGGLIEQSIVIRKIEGRDWFRMSLNSHFRPSRKKKCNVITESFLK